MKLLYHITIRLSLFLSIILTAWAVLFYIAMLDEINDEVDDSLEDYSEQIIIRALAGDSLPSNDSGSNNQYFLSEITNEYANKVPHIRYVDSMIYITQKRETEPARILYTIFKDKQGQYYELTVSTPTIEKKDLKEAILYWVIFLYVSLLVIIIVINVWIYYRSTRPLHKLLNWLDNYRIGGQNTSLKNNTDITEFRKLNESAVESMKRAESAFEKQKQFIGNASHEIQTPVAVCLNRLEMLMDDDTLSEGQLEELGKTYQTLEYITKLNRSLLLLSKIDNNQFVERKEIDINNLLKSLLPDYIEIYSSMNITVNVVENAVCFVKMNDSLAAIMISNLLKNAYTHNMNDGSIEIEIDETSILFKNSGQKLPLDKDHIFDRFYQGSKKEGSTGLGLAIVKSIVDVENLNIQYYFEADKHCFEISIKF